MVPRSVTLFRVTRTRNKLGPGVYSPWSESVSSDKLSQLYDIQSDNVKRGRTQSPLGYKKARANGYKTSFIREPKNTTYTKRKIYYACGNYSYFSNPTSYPQPEVEGGYLGMPFVTMGSSSLLAAADKRVKSRFFGKLKNTEFDLAITVAERAQTKVMIARRAVLLLNIKRFFKSFWKRVRQRSIQKHESIAQALGNAWLEFAYGWRQLASDIFAIASFSASRTQNRWVKTRVETSETIDRSQYDSSTGLRIYATETRSIFSEMKIKLNVTADPVLDLTRLSTLNPVAIAWELLPFSFVFDWILNISSYLSELQTRAMFSCSLGGGYITHVQHFELHGSYPAQNNKGTSLTFNIPQEVKFSDLWVKKSRDTFSSAPLPVFPSLKSPISVEHALTTLSLVVQRMSPKNLGRHGRFQ